MRLSQDGRALGGALGRALRMGAHKNLNFLRNEGHLRPPFTACVANAYIANACRANALSAGWARTRKLELLEELGLVAAVKNVVDHILPFVQVLDDQVVSRERSRRDRFLVRVLAVNHTSVTLLGLLVDRVPDLGDPGARRVHDLNVSLVQEAHLLQVPSTYYSPTTGVPQIEAEFRHAGTITVVNAYDMFSI